MPGYESAAWVDFALGQLGASAALVGLVFVALSINLRSVIRSAPLVHRAGEAVVLLGIVLLSATAVLIPEQSRGALAAELIVLGTGIFAVVWMLQRGPNDQPLIPVLMRRVTGLGAPALVVLAGITFVLEGGGGLYWLPAAIALAFIGALGGAWVLLVEILR